MKVQLDLTKTYAIALEGGGAKGGYEIGVWKALEEMGVKYNAVAGTSVGALNGAMMAMRDLPRAISAWKDISLEKVIDFEKGEEENLKKIVSGDIELGDIQQVFSQVLDVIRSGGLDVAPLRAWVREVVDSKKVKESDVRLFVETVSLTERKGLDICVSDLEEDEICRLEKLGGKLYTDGGFIDNLPIDLLVENGYKDIIAVQIPGKIKFQRKFKVPEDVNIWYIDTDADLGGTLNFSSDQARRDMEIGYYDAWHDLCGLYGKKYYIERSMTEREAFAQIIERYLRKTPDVVLRELCEKELPRLAKGLEVEGDYYDLFVALMEVAAEERGLEKMRFYTDTEFLTLIRSTQPLPKEEEAPAEESAPAEEDEATEESGEAPAPERIEVMASAE